MVLRTRPAFPYEDFFDAWPDEISGVSHAQWLARPVCELAVFNTPGVRVTEGIAGPIPADIQTFQALKLVGESLRGPVANLTHPPDEISSPKVMEDVFKPKPGGYPGSAVKNWVEHGGSQSAYFARAVGAGSAIATINLPDATPATVITVNAKGPGTDYHNVTIAYDADASRMIIYDFGEVAEVYEGVAFANADRMVQFINGRSNIVNIIWVDKTKNPVTTVAPIALAGGLNGASVTASVILGTEVTKTGLYAFARDHYELPLGFVSAPGWPQQTVGLGLIDIASRFWQMAMIDSTFGLSLAQLKTERNQYSHPFGKGIYVAGWIEQPDPSQVNVRNWFPRSAARAALIAASHANPNSLANVGAGLGAIYRNVTALEFDTLTDADQDDLNHRGIDLARNFTVGGQGRVQWAARTIAAPDNVLYRFCHVPIIANVLAVTTMRVLRQYVFGVIDGRDKGLPSRIKTTLQQMLWAFWDAGILFGATAGESSAVVIKGTALNLENGILPIDIYFKPSAIAERITVNLLRVQIGYNPLTGQTNVSNIDLAPDHTVL